jgi:hypothetical protein
MLFGDDLDLLIDFGTIVILLTIAAVVSKRLLGGGD